MDAARDAGLQVCFSLKDVRTPQCFRHSFAVCSVLTPGFQKVAPEDPGMVPQRSKTAEERVVAADLFLVDRYSTTALRATALHRSPARRRKSATLSRG